MNVITVRDCLSSDTRSILPIPALKELYTAFTIGSTIDAQHAEIPDVHSELFNSTASECIARGD